MTLCASCGIRRAHSWLRFATGEKEHYCGHCSFAIRDLIAYRRDGSEGWPQRCWGTKKGREAS